VRRAGVLLEMSQGGEERFVLRLHFDTEPRSRVERHLPMGVEVGVQKSFVEAALEHFGP